MKYYPKLILFLLVCSLQVYAGEKQMQQRKIVYDVGMAASIKHFDSVLHHWIQLRLNNKIDETVFLRHYDQEEHLYQEQQQRVATLASDWIAETTVFKQTKPIRSALALVLKDKPEAAIASLSHKLKQKNKGLDEYLFLSELYQLCGRYDKAENILNEASTHLEGSLYVCEWQRAKILSLNGQDSIAIALLRQATIALEDTLVMARAKMDMSELYARVHHNNDAQSQLIEAQYLLEQMGVKEEANRVLLAVLSSRLAELQMQNSNIDNAYHNAKKAVSLFDQYPSENTASERAKAYHVLAAVYQKAGANKEADSLYQKTIAQYQELVNTNPERFQPLLAVVMEEYAAVQHYFDRNDAYDKTLRSIIDLRQNSLPQNYPFFLLAQVRTLNVLGQKLMNDDVKIFLAEEEWAKAKEILVLQHKKNPMLFGDDLCGILYKLGGVRIALKKRPEGLPFFEQSLQVRTELYQWAPSRNKRDYLDILTQNASLNALEKNKDKTIKLLDKAYQIADELGEKKRAEEIARFKNDFLTH